MTTLFTTEKTLNQCLHDKKWMTFLLSQKEIVYSKAGENEIKDEDKKALDKMLDDLHRAHVLYTEDSEFINDLPNSPVVLRTEINPIVFLEVPEDKLESLRNKSCAYWDLPSRMNQSPIINKQRHWRSNDPQKTHKWKAFLSPLDRHFNSVLIIDRYLFNPTWNKRGDDLDEDWEDCESSLKNILDSVLPDAIDNDIFVATVIIELRKYRDRNTGRVCVDEEWYQNVTNSIDNICEGENPLNRQYSFRLELLTIDGECAYFNDTHDRYVITNYSYANLTRQLRVFREHVTPPVTIAAQEMNWYYLFSTGLDGDDSLPMVTHSDVIKSMTKLIYDYRNKSNDYIRLYSYGCQLDFEPEKIENKLIQWQIEEFSS